MVFYGTQNSTGQACPEGGGVRIGTHEKIASNCWLSNKLEKGEIPVVCRLGQMQKELLKEIVTRDF